jgi:hypothetical protein
MKKIILIVVLFFSLISFGQTPINKVIYYDSIRKETFSKDYYFKEIIKEYNLEKDSYEVEYFQNSQNVVILSLNVSVQNVSFTHRDSFFLSFFLSFFHSFFLSFYCFSPFSHMSFKLEVLQM